MTHFYFDLVEDGKIVHDDTGVDFATVDEAEIEARRALADLIREEIREGTSGRNAGEVMVHIREHDTGPVLKTVSFSYVYRTTS